MDEDSASESGRKLSKPRNKRTHSKDTEEPVPVATDSLARTLVQALHSSDTGLLETCLVHGDERIIMNTVRRLPPQLSVPLLNECVERLGRGAGGNRGKYAVGGGASSQRGTVLVKWVRAVLVIHTAHLMNVRMALFLRTTRD